MRLTNLPMAPICALAAIAGASAYAEEPASKGSSAQSATAPVSAPAPVSATTATPAVAPPPPVDRKKALQFGFRPAVMKGIPVFCKEVPIEGTRFTNKRCVREDEFSVYLAQLQVARDTATKSGCLGADFCGNLESMPGKPRMSMGSTR